MIIPPEVVVKRCVNHLRLKVQGSSKMFIRRGLAGPKCCPNWNSSKGKPVNIQVPWGYVAAMQGKFYALGYAEFSQENLIAEICGS